MIDRLSQVIALYIHSKSPKNRIGVMKLSLEVGLNIFFIVSISLIIGAITHKLLETIICLSVIATLKRYTGGRHLKSGDLCVLVSVVIVAFCVQFPIYHWLNYILTLCSAILIFLFTPFQLINQAFGNPIYFKKLRNVSTALVLLNLLVVSPVLTLSFLVHALTLVHKKERR